MKKTLMKEFDVYAYGVISSSTLHLLNQPFPRPDGYAEISQTHLMTGGEALNSAIVLSRLGLRVQLDGNWIGDNLHGTQLLEIIRKFQIDTSRLTVKEGYAGVQEIVFSDHQSRTIFGNYIDLLSSSRKWNIPQKEDIQNARIVCIDPPFRTESELVAQYAIDLAVPFVSIDCAYDHMLATGAAAVIISGEFRNREYPGYDLQELFREYQSRAKGLVILTSGDEDILYGRKGETIQHFKPYQVKVVDSAGAGDSFRAGVVFGLFQGWGDLKIVQYASALAGMICERFPGVLDSPDHAEVMEFIYAKDQNQINL